MTCREAEPLLALWAGEDLLEVAALEAHVERCGRCALVLAELRDSQSLVGVLKQDEPCGEVVDQVRRRVLSRVGVDRSWRWWATAAATAAVLAFWWAGPFGRPEPQPPISQVLPVAAPPGGLMPVALPTPARQVRAISAALRGRAGIRGATLVPRDEAAPEIHLQTENPNVLIVLIPEAGEKFDETR